MFLLQVIFVLLITIDKKHSKANIKNKIILIFKIAVVVIYVNKKVVNVAIGFEHGDMIFLIRPFFLG